MENKKVSVIIPVYNVEKYLPRCLDSVINQTYQNLEIILIDDGSDDGSPRICDEYAEKDERIKVIHKKNGGVGKARNDGLDIASGDYIGFVDSDDRIEPDMYEMLMSYADKYNADIARCDVYLEYENQDYKRTCDGEENVRVLDCVQALKETVFTNVNMAVWNKIFKAEILKNAEFGNKRCGEDWEFNYSVLKNSGSAVSVYVGFRKYHYLMRSGSATHKWDEQSMIDSFDLFEKIYENEKDNSEIFPYACRGYVQHNIPIIREAILEKQEKSKMTCDMLKKIKEKEPILKKHITSRSGKIRLIMICHSFGLYKIYVKLTRKKVKTQ